MKEEIKGVNSIRCEKTKDRFVECDLFNKHKGHNSIKLPSVEDLDISLKGNKVKEIQDVRSMMRARDYIQLEFEDWDNNCIIQYVYGEPISRLPLKGVSIACVRKKT